MEAQPRRSLDSSLRWARGAFAFLLVPVTVGWGVTRIDLPLALAVEAYEDGRAPLFSDRPYVNAAAHPGLQGFQVVRLPRHLRSQVELSVSDQASIVRLLCDRNDNRALSDWEPLTQVEVDVPGRSCSLRSAVAKRVGPGVHRLPAGGPICSSPVLVATEGRIEARSIRSLNKFVVSGKRDWMAFIRDNKWKLLAAAGAYLAYCSLLRRLLVRRPWRSAPPGA